MNLFRLAGIDLRKTYYIGEDFAVILGKFIKLAWYSMLSTAACVGMRGGGRETADKGGSAKSPVRKASASRAVDVEACQRQ